MNHKVVAVLVSNDLSTDQRVSKICGTIEQLGFVPLLLGRKLPNSSALSRKYPVKRFSLWVNNGPLFYLFLNLRFTVFLLFRKLEVVYANDLDTLPAASFIASLKRIPLIYDSHEFFTQVPELVNRPFKQKIWQIIERVLIYKADTVITVNNAIAGLFKEHYNIQASVMRNVPNTNLEIDKLSKADLLLEDNTHILIMQGAGINIERGAEELLLSLNYLPNNFVLFFIGGGDVYKSLQLMAKQNKLKNRVFFINKLPWQKMMAYTKLATFGFSLDKPNADNYKFSLPNKIFDYLKAETPIICSNLVEPSVIIKETGAGVTIEKVDAKLIAETVLNILNSPAFYDSLKSAAKQNANRYSWQQESLAIKNALKKLND